VIRAAACAWLLALTLLAWPPAGAQIPVPPLRGHVTDETATLSEPQKADLERTLAEFEARKGSQLAVLVVRTTAPEAIEQYTLRVAEVWKLGRKRIDDGAILVVARDDHALRIEVGYGLEGAITDATAHRIIDEVIVPRFQQQDFAGGIAAGVDGMIRVIDGEPLPPPQHAPAAQDFGQVVPIAVIVAFALGAVLRALLGRLPGALATGGLVAVATFWLVGALSLALVAGLIALLTALFGGLGPLRGTSGWGGLGGGMGRGGFSGGGGGFGGGGSSGRW